MEYPFNLNLGLLFFGMVQLEIYYSSMATVYVFQKSSRITTRSLASEIKTRGKCMKRTPFFDTSIDTSL